MSKPIDLSKFRKDITKSVEGISIGTRNPDTWIDLGNKALNWLISGDFTKGVPLGKVTVLAGDSGAGKSYISANAIKWCLENDIIVVAMDSENALDDDWLTRLGIDTEHPAFLKFNVSQIDHCAGIIAGFMKDYQRDYGSLAVEDRPKVLFVIDSLGMLGTPTDAKQFEAGDLKGDMGRKPRALNALVRNCVVQFGNHNIGLLATNHTYASQDMFDPDAKIPGGQGFIYASSIVLALQKLKLKEDADGNKTSEVLGIRTKVQQRKSRFNFKGLYKTIEMRITFEAGLSPYSGLLDLFESQDILQKDGNKLKYVSLDGTEHKYFRKQIGPELLDLIISEYATRNGAEAAPTEQESDHGEYRDQDDH
jgi:hypothetical protein